MQKRKNVWPQKQFLSSPENFRRPFFSRWLRISSLPFHLPKFLMTFFRHFLDFYISTNHKSPQVQLHKQFLLTFFHHSIKVFSTFFGFHPSFPLSHFQIYNYNCTIAILQLQITFYNCRNCHQLHVKICPAVKVTLRLPERPGIAMNAYCWDGSSCVGSISKMHKKYP